MKQLAVKTSEIVNYASRNVVMNGSDSLTATAKAMELATLKARMMRGECVKFAYTKLDGSVRIAVGTLQKDSVEASVNGNGLPKRFYGMFAYQDLLCNLEWRAFKFERFIGTIEN